MVKVATRRSKDGPQTQRLLPLAAIYEGATRTEAALIGGVTLQIIRDWVLKFNADGPERLIDRKSPGQPPRLNATHRAALGAIIENGPIAAVHGVSIFGNASEPIMRSHLVLSFFREIVPADAIQELMAMRQPPETELLPG